MFVSSGSARGQQIQMTDSLDFFSSLFYLHFMKVDCSVALFIAYWGSSPNRYWSNDNSKQRESFDPTVLVRHELWLHSGGPLPIPGLYACYCQTLHQHKNYKNFLTFLKTTHLTGTCRLMQTPLKFNISCCD